MSSFSTISLLCFSSDQNLNITESYPLTSPYKPFIDPRHLHVPPVTPTTPTSTNHEASFFPSNFNFGSGNFLRSGVKRRSSSSSGVPDDSSTYDENASSESSVDSLASRRRVSFRFDAENLPEKREKIGNRRMSAPAFGNQPLPSPAYDTPFYNSMVHPGTPNWLYPSPFSNPLFGYHELLHRMDSRSYLSPGFLSPIYPPFSPGGMYPPYSPFLKRASSFPNITPNTDTMYPNGDNILSPRVPPYDPFSYFVSNPTSSSRSNDISPVAESLGTREDKEQDEKDGKVNGREEEAEIDDQNSNHGKIKY